MNSIKNIPVLLGLFILCFSLSHAESHDNPELEALIECRPNCGPNSYCVMPGVCRCHKGHVENKGLCEPICSNGCGNHSICVAPEQCACEKDYRTGQKNNTCLPICIPECGDHGDCVASGVCQCHEGYTYSQHHKSCQPLCMKHCGRHGVCIAPGKCGCIWGYELDKKDSKCYPKCDPRCGKNSYCASYKRCKCRTGYKPNDIHSLTCSLPLKLWFYLLIGLSTILILCCVAFGIFYCLRRSRNINYYPNSTFVDTTRIIQ